MKELKCNNCGAKIHTDGTQNKIICNYCGTEYKDTLDYNININMDSNSKAVKTIVFTIIIIAIGMMSSIAISFSTNTTNFDNKQEEFQREMFNSEFEIYTGEQSRFFVEILLGKVITNNNEGERIISVYYQDVVAVSQSEIQTLLKSLENKEYFIGLNYSSDGYINSLVIED